MNKNSENTILLMRTSAEISFLCNADHNLSRAIDLIGDMTYALHIDPYTFLIDTIISQMLSKRVAEILIQRMCQLCNLSVSPEVVIKISVDDMRSIGISNQKAEYIHLLTKSVMSKHIIFSSLASLPDDEVIRQLTSQRGIGNWSAKMYLIFHLNRLNVIPYEDGAFLQAFSWLYDVQNPKKEDVEEIAAKWEPYASIAARYLYKVLDNGYTNNQRSKVAFNL